MDGIREEEMNWLKYFLKKGKMGREDLMNYILENGWLIYNVFDIKEAYDYINKRYIKTSKRKKKEILDELNLIENIPGKQKKEFIRKTKEVGKKEKELSKALRELAESRLQVKMANNSLEVIVNLKLLKFISDKYGVAYRDLLDGYFPDDINNLIRRKNKLNKTEIENRKRFIIWLCNNGKISILTGQKAKKKCDQLLKDSIPDKNQKILEGQIASKGKGGNISGRARIISLGDNKKLEQDIKKFKKGEIVVTIMTQPNIMPIARKASGIITDEGGICSHAAIISRELAIPCIVGTESATKVIRDGDRLNIDIERGIVKIIR